MNSGSSGLAYDRRLLLEDTKRNVVLDLTEVQRYGIESWGDPDYVCIYGLRPADWYGKGIRIIGRTTVERTRDQLADNIGRDIATVAKSAPLTSGALVLDPFTGSGNTLYWMLRHLPGAQGMGFEQDPIVFKLTSRNLAILNLSIEVSNCDYRSGLSIFKNGTGSIAGCVYRATLGRCIEREHGSGSTPHDTAGRRNR